MPFDQITSTSNKIIIFTCSIPVILSSGDTGINMNHTMTIGKGKKDKTRGIKRVS